jgi:predicted HicB family RNase H-like nuclease
MTDIAVFIVTTIAFILLIIYVISYLKEKYREEEETIKEYEKREHSENQLYDLNRRAYNNFWADIYIRKQQRDVLKDKKILECKGYITQLHYIEKTGLLIGKIEGIKDLVNFESDVNNIESEFYKAVDDYLNFCYSKGKEPEPSYKNEVIKEMIKMGATESELLLLDNATVLNGITHKSTPEDVAWAILQ